MITNKKQIANIFNDYFSHIMDGFCEMNEAIIENTDKRSVVDRFKFFNVNEAQIRVLLSEINTRKSCGHDFLSHRLIKESAQEIAGPFAHIINTSINQCQYPQHWKMGQLTPLFKKEDDLNKANYRPITVLPCLNNIFERVLSCQLDKFYNDILVDYISSYRKHYSCETSLLRLFEDLKKSLDNKETVAVISMDLSKAFDAIPHALLLAKLKAYGLGVNASTLISSYLCGRFQRVKIGDAYSKWEKVTKGVPQGSILGPMFFNIFLNDLFYHINTIKLNAYADDEQLYDSDKDPVALEKHLKDGVNVANTWYKDNGMIVNPNKHEAIIFGKTNHVFSFAVKESIELFGLVMDKDLSFNEHISKICKTINNQFNVMIRFRNLIPRNITTKLYKTFILPHFYYCSCLWHFGYSRDLDKLHSKNNLVKISWLI